MKKESKTTEQQCNKQIVKCRTYKFYKKETPDDIVIKTFAENPEASLQVAYNILGEEALTLNFVPE